MNNADNDKRNKKKEKRRDEEEYEQRPDTGHHRRNHNHSSDNESDVGATTSVTTADQPTNQIKRNKPANKQRQTCILKVRHASLTNESCGPSRVGRICEGVRFLDLRVKGDGWLYHGPLACSLTLEAALQCCAHFLQQHDKEFIVLSRFARKWVHRSPSVYGGPETCCPKLSVAYLP